MIAAVVIVGEIQKQLLNEIVLAVGAEVPR